MSASQSSRCYGSRWEMPHKPLARKVAWSISVDWLAAGFVQIVNLREVHRLPVNKAMTARKYAQKRGETMNAQTCIALGAKTVHLDKTSEATATSLSDIACVVTAELRFHTPTEIA